MFLAARGIVVIIFALACGVFSSAESSDDAPQKILKLAEPTLWSMGTAGPRTLAR
jgi:hypothetical protein